MTLFVLKGKSKSVNRKLLFYAADHIPALVIDCANCANPHSLYPMHIQNLDHIFVVQAEMLYKFRDTLKYVDVILKDLALNCIVITTFDSLINYGDETENKAIFEHIWQFIGNLAKFHEVIVGVTANSIHEAFAWKYA
jgi:hypothetical protein